MKSPATRDAAAAIEALQAAARLNSEDPLRSGALQRLPAFGQVVMTGDLHGHRRNFEKLIRFAQLDRTPHRHIVLHELIHEETLPGEPDRSFELLLDAAQLKCDYPEQVHFLQSNHEMAQYTGQRIGKGGRDVVEDFNQAVLAAFGRTEGAAVCQAIRAFLGSYPLAIRTPNRVWLSHSLPNEQDLTFIDPGVVLHGGPEAADFQHGSFPYCLVWGRYHGPRIVEALSRAWDVDLFVIGHQPQETGYATLAERIIILASDHNHGAFLPFDLSKPQTLDSLTQNIRKFVEVP